jgi:3alpha(or 20beta)-hydroxysteroid dehydrogenase
MGRLSDKIILITGAARGQGAAEAVLCATEGATVYIADILDAEGETLAAKISAEGGHASYHHLDVSDELGWSKITTEIENQNGRLDGLVNNAGVLSGTPLEAIELSEWNRVIGINLTGAFLGIKHCAPLLRRVRGSSIVNVGSLAAMTGVAQTAYGASKWGIRGLTKSAAVSLAPDGTRVNTVHPGMIDTPILPDDPKMRAAVVRGTPLQRLGLPVDIAQAVLFLLSAEASFMTGVDIEVDGGVLNGLHPAMYG